MDKKQDKNNKLNYSYYADFDEVMKKKPKNLFNTKRK